MPGYQVRLTRTLEGDMLVDAETPDDAIEEAKRIYLSTDEFDIPEYDDLYVVNTIELDDDHQPIDDTLEVK